MTGSREVSPNRSEAIKYLIAGEDGCVEQQEFRKTFKIDASRQIRVERLAFVRYKHPGLEYISIFLRGW